MSRSLVLKEEVVRLKVIDAHLKLSQSNEAIVIPAEDAAQLRTLLQKIFNLDPVVIDDYLTPNQAAKISGVSRPVITEMLEGGLLAGHKVKSHWKVQKRSLIDYINQRDIVRQAVSAMDEDGFGLD